MSLSLGRFDRAGIMWILKVSAKAHTTDNRKAVKGIVSDCGERHVDITEVVTFLSV